MMINTKHTVKEVRYVIENLGSTATLNKSTGTNYRTFALQDTIKATGDMGNSPNPGVSSGTIMYIPGDIRAAPSVGDYLTVNKTQWYILEVDTSIIGGNVMAYTCKVT